MYSKNQAKIWKIIKTDTGIFCPKCHLEKIKVKLKEYPNHLLVCGSCQSAFKIIGDDLISIL